MEENQIYFNASFKSFDITRWDNDKGEWYEWIERSRKMMHKFSMSRKVTEWICQCLREASKEKKEIRRWRMAEHESELYCTRKHNIHGRFISIITLYRWGRSGIIIPELALNAGWLDIALKIDRFIKYSKWQSRNLRNAEIKNMRGTVEILDKIGAQEGDLLSRCLKNVFRMNIYELNDERFLFEFPNKNMAEQIIQGQNMDQISGDPLHLWSKKVFQEIGEIYGGWVAMEEETKLKNHMKWARIQPECSPRFEIMLENDKGKDDTFYPVQRFNQRVLGERICDVDSESHQLRGFPTLQHVAPANKVMMSAREGHAWCIGPDVAAQVIVNNYQGEIEGLLTTQRSFDCVEEIRAQRVVLGENSPTFSRIVGKSVEDTDKQVESNQATAETDHDNNRGKEKETSNWVQQNLIKLGKIFGVDFQGHEEEAMELLLQIDSCRLARRQEQCSEIKKSKTKGVQEF
ncbi:hypothetical protein H5410_019301 [Solanum commersonii]|uniref:DUF4283 domain-containing protein n=1 Tax=Solanum commersonii TaxID=4109 RepID=A0A9J6A4J9_SOLCO|nr:hypothetical protein H5410_019301 [Solanum commersonii]